MRSETKTQALFQIARRAALQVMRVYSSDFGVEFKTPTDPITEADRRANDVIVTALEALFPRTPIIAEESSNTNWESQRTAPEIFFVDPVDGTWEFVHKTGDFSVMIGLAGTERCECGVLLAPARREAWLGSHETGAQHLLLDADLNPRTTRQLRFSAAKPARAPRLVVSQSDRSTLLQSCLEEVQPAQVYSVGSAGLKTMEVVMQRADAYLAPEHRGMRWDCCAPEAILTAAGGRFSDASGQPLDYRAKSLKNLQGVLAARPDYFPALTAKTTSIIKAHFA
ncbi:MAG: 3'(2'),5'-bisphosphate nucleotidase CysQ [Polyangiaceae bacterium]|nr:3'(2'),5'-bisphosphate nucleotidase CysQ [Polyangiaceae bacterium]